MDRKVVASGLWDALEAADADLRVRYPYVFWKVDRIKAQPGWTPSTGIPRETPHGYCEWCGRLFVGADRAESREPQKYCSRKCGWAARRVSSRP